MTEQIRQEGNLVSDGDDSARIPGDNPIRGPQDDVLERTDIAEQFAKRVLDLDVSEGAVVGVFGPWGSGKTSFVNLARTVFDREEVPVLEFNPWLFSGADQLVGRFFTELSVELKLHDLGEVGKALENWPTSVWPSHSQKRTEPQVTTCIRPGIAVTLRRSPPSSRMCGSPPNGP